MLHSTLNTSCSFTYQYFRFVYFFSDFSDAVLLPVLYSEVTCASSNLKEKVAQHLHASLCQVNLRVKLCPIQFLLLISNP